MFLGMTAVHHLSKTGTRDYFLLISGLLANSLGYILMYMLWHREYFHHFARSDGDSVNNLLIIPLPFQEEYIT